MTTYEVELDVKLTIRVDASEESRAHTIAESYLDDLMKSPQGQRWGDHFVGDWSSLEIGAG